MGHDADFGGENFGTIQIFLALKYPRFLPDELVVRKNTLANVHEEGS